jgi:hypothetical protein
MVSTLCTLPQTLFSVFSPYPRPHTQLGAYGGSEGCLWSLLNLCSTLFLHAAFQPPGIYGKVHYGSLIPWISLLNSWLIYQSVACPGQSQNFRLVALTFLVGLLLMLHLCLFFFFKFWESNHATYLLYCWTVPQPAPVPNNVQDVGFFCAMLQMQPVELSCWWGCMGKELPCTKMPQLHFSPELSSFSSTDASQFVVSL